MAESDLRPGREVDQPRTQAEARRIAAAQVELVRVEAMGPADRREGGRIAAASDAADRRTGPEVLAATRLRAAMPCGSCCWRASVGCAKS